jgi:hypothetical protein
MFLVMKNNDADGTATITWIQAFYDIQSCTITFDTKVVGGTDVLLVITTLSGANRDVRMPDPVSCAQILEIIRLRKNGVTTAVPPVPSTEAVIPVGVAKDLSVSEFSLASSTLEGAVSVPSSITTTPGKRSSSSTLALPFTSPALLKRKRNEQAAISVECLGADDLDPTLDLLPGESEEQYVTRYQIE